MSEATAPNTTFLSRLPASVYYQIVHLLRLLLPPPATDSPEDLVLQLESAIAEIGSFAPANAAEARLAARHVAFGAHADECLRLAREAAANGHPEKAEQCRAQAAAMARQGGGQFNMLMRLQKERRSLEKDTQAHGRAAWAEHCATGLMADALAEQMKPQPTAAPSFSAPQPTAQPPAPEPIAEPPAPEPQPQSQPAEDPEPAPLTEAERYAVLYPQRAALIRKAGRVPDDIPFDQPDDFVQELLTAQGPIFTELDRRFA